jgi:hypothetical protein
MSVAEIKKAASELPVSEQAELAAWLLEQLPDISGEEAIDEDVTEARARQNELDSGKSRLVSSEEFWKSVKNES